MLVLLTVLIAIPSNYPSLLFFSSLISSFALGGIRDGPFLRPFSLTVIRGSTSQPSQGLALHVSLPTGTKDNEEGYPIPKVVPS